MGVNTNAFGSPHLAALSGIGTTPLTITPSSVSFSSTNVGLASTPQQVTVRNNQSVPVNSMSLSVSGDFAVDVVGTTCGPTLAATQSCVISLTMTPTVAGPRTGSLVITSDTTESPNAVALSGSGINGVTASVTSLTFASQLVDTTSGPQQVLLTNHQAVPAALGTLIAGDFAAVDACGGTIPALSSCAVSITFTPTAVGTRNGTATFNNPGSDATVVSLTGEGASENPPAAVASVSPGTGTVGTTVQGVVVTGNGYTNFGATSTISFGADVTVSNARNVAPNTVTVDVAIAGTAAPGARTVTVITPLAGGGTETASLTAGFVVSASANLPLASITPNQGAQGQTLDVAIVGTDTHFQAGTTFATFGDGVVGGRTHRCRSDARHGDGHRKPDDDARLAHRHARDRRRAGHDRPDRFEWAGLPGGRRRRDPRVGLTKLRRPGCGTVCGECDWHRHPLSYRALPGCRLAWGSTSATFRC